MPSERQQLEKSWGITRTLLARASPGCRCLPHGLLDPHFNWRVVGLMVLLPFAYVCAVTLPQGAQRFREYWRFYELKWGVGLRGLRWVYVPIAVLGLVSLVMVIRSL